MSFDKDIEELKKEFTPLKTCKFIAGTIISLGAASAIVAALKNPVKGAKGLGKIMMILGVYVLGSKAGDIAEKHFNDTVDNFVKMIGEAKQDESKPSE